MPTYPLQLTCLGVIYGTPLLASIFVILRIYTRRKLNLRLSWDDWLIILPLLLSIALIGPSHRHVKMWHVGVHIWQVPVDEIEPNYDEYYAVVMAFNLLNIPILPLVKASIILLLLRAGSVIEWLKRVLYAILVFTVGSALIPWFLYIFICPPLTGNTWKPRTFGGVTAIGAAKIYLSYRDRLYTLFNPDWTYPIDYCINHIENNVAIIVANIPILRGLVTRWIFNFRTKATPMEREFRGDWQHSNRSSSSDISRYTRKNRVVQKILPCIQDDFSSSLATRSKGDVSIRGECRQDFPPRVVTTGELRHQKRSYFPRSRRNSLDRYETADSCEKGDLLETVRSVGSLGSAPTLVESKDVGAGWKSMDSPTLSPTTPTIRFSNSTLSPIAPLTPARLRGIEDGEDDDEIYPYPRL
ncbi:unnamed protein product [Alternaria alternata]